MLKFSESQHANHLRQPLFRQINGSDLELTQTTILFFILAFVSEIVGTVSGFGSSVFFVPLAGLLFDLKTTLALTGILHIFSTTAQVYLFRKEIDWNLFIKIGIPSVIFVFIGAEMNDHVELKYAELALGIFLVAFATVLFFASHLRLKPTNLNSIVGGAIAGFLAGLIGTGGAIRGVTLSAFGLPKGTFVGTSAGIDLTVDLSRTFVYLRNGYLSSSYYWYIPVLMILAYAGVLVGKKILSTIPQNLFRKIVLLIILLTGLFTIYNFVIQ